MIRAFALHSRGEGRVFPVVREQLHTGGVFGGDRLCPAPLTGFPIDDLTFVVTHFLPHLSHDAVYRILKAEGLERLPPAHRRKRESGTFKT
jgi:hypothetical protein